MPLTKSAFRDRVRELAGDPLRISGTATGGSISTIIDTNRLTQIDGYWDKLWAFVVTTGDGNAPKGEDRRISAFANTTKQLTLELPFSAAVESGDTYGIAVFSNARIDNAISRVLKEFSYFRPVKFNEDLAVTVNEKRFTPISSAVIREVDKIEYYSPGVEHAVYDFVWSNSTRKVEFPDWVTTARTLKLYGTKSHTLPASDGDAMTYHDDDEDRLVRWCAARVMESMTADEFRDNFGKLTPQSWTRGKVSESHSSGRDQFLKHLEDVIDGIKLSFPSINI